MQAYQLSDDVNSGYRFRSTSPYTPMTGTTFRGSDIPSGPYRSSTWNWDDPDEDDPIGVIPDPTPLGAPWVLVIFVVLYMAFLAYRRLRRSCSPQDGSTT